MHSPMVTLQDLVVPPELLAQVPASIASRYQVVPLHREDHTLQLAMAEPFDVRVLDELRVLLGCEVRPSPAPAQEIRETIQRSYGLGAEAVERVLDGRMPATSRPNGEDAGALMDDSSIASFVNQLIRQALQDRATDIHLEPFEGVVRVRQRIDGMLYELPMPAELIRLYPMIVSRIKVMARLDIAERRLPQDGHFKFKVDDRLIDFRVSVLPSAFGGNVCLRVLDKGKMSLDLDALGFAPRDLEQLKACARRPHGMILLTGPTGSGKTTTLYALLTSIDRPEKNLVTVEDPVEYELAGINQVNTRADIGLTFAKALRSILRQDPDVIMVGEIRDKETAEIAIQASLTGHLVFATIHTNDAPGAVTRLVDMGVEPFLVSSSLLAVLAQRLMRKVCANCRELQETTVVELENLGLDPSHFSGAKIARPKGCHECTGTGYKGRTVVHELMLVDDEIRSLIMQKVDATSIKKAAQSPGMVGLRQKGIEIVLQGLSTPIELVSVTQE